MTTDLNALVEAASAARENAYADYSHYRVGVAILDENGNIHAGCNVENAAYPLGSCAEANAIGAMVSAGGRRIVRLLILASRETLEASSPCGGCRQRIAEFADEGTDIVLQNDEGSLAHYSIDALLPNSFAL